MRELLVSFEDTRIPFAVGYDCEDEILTRVLELEPDSVLIITDETVNHLYGKQLERKLSESVPALSMPLVPGESKKLLCTVQEVAERAIEWGVTRRSLILALGGGVPGNLGGLVAALLYRGIRLVHMPTTLIGMADSVVSLKQAVNSGYGKNHFGTYYEPEMVVADLRMLETLPEREMRSGMCECVKNALAISPEFIEPLRGMLRADSRYDRETLEAVVIESIAAKQRVMANDRCERKTALILEYGHTVGHAIELASYHQAGAEPRAHGDSVALGMLFAAEVALDQGLLSAEDVDVHRDLVARVGIPPAFPKDLAWPVVRKLLRYDNKRGYQAAGPDELTMVLLCGLGRPAGPIDRPLTRVPLAALDRAHANLA